MGTGINPTHRFFAPAKLNLFLHVIGQRGDGYHLLQSVFRLIDFGDTLHLRIRDDGVIERMGDFPGVPEEDDLTLRAARLLQPFAQPGAGVSIGIDKRLPMGGGLGGGSSDAATVLLVLNRLWQLNLSRQRLQARHQLGVGHGGIVPMKAALCIDAQAHGLGRGRAGRSTRPCGNAGRAPRRNRAGAA